MNNWRKRFRNEFGLGGLYANREGYLPARDVMQEVEDWIAEEIESMAEQMELTEMRCAAKLERK